MNIKKSPKQNLRFAAAASVLLLLFSVCKTSATTLADSSAATASSSSNSAVASSTPGAESAEAPTADNTQEIKDPRMARVANEPEHTTGNPLAKKTNAIPAGYYDEASQQGTLITIEYETMDRSGSGESITKPALVYLPYGYDEADEGTKYNIFYLIHGWTGTAETFFHHDDSNALKNVLDNMIENGDTEPLIVVTPTFERNNDEAASLEDSVLQIKVFHEELVGELIHAVESRFHTYAETINDAGLTTSREHRAFGGFSLGAAIAWDVFLNHMDYYKYYMPMSGSCWALQDFARGAEISKETAAYLADYVRNSEYQSSDLFIYTATGSRDTAFDMADPLATALLEHDDVFNDSNVGYGIKDGAIHWWDAVTDYLYNGLPLFFK